MLSYRLSCPGNAHVTGNHGRGIGGPLHLRSQHVMNTNRVSSSDAFGIRKLLLQRNSHRRNIVENPIAHSGGAVALGVAGH